MYRVQSEASPAVRQASRCPFPHDGISPKPAGKKRHETGHGNVLGEIREWMARDVRCVAGRREYTRGNYLVRVANRQLVPAILEEFKDSLRRRAAVACLFVFADRRYRAGAADAAAAFRFLAEEMSIIAKVAAADLANGAALSTSIELTCPVTGRDTVYDDFECVAFCPQSMDRSDPLYDPLMYAPYPVVNMSSDVYGFSCFVAESAMQALGRPVYEEEDGDRVRALFDVCVERWHRIAIKTIANFAAVTDTSLCPVHATADGRHWIAGHRDPAFAESRKIAHAHELPVIYARRIADRWLDHFDGKTNYCAVGAAHAGLPIATEGNTGC